MKNMSEDTLRAIDFFCSGGGMTSGFVRGGVDVIAGIDNDIQCKETYEINNTSSSFILADMFELKEEELAKRLQISKNDDDLIFIGCSPCQFWSVIQTDKTKSAKSKNLLLEFKRFVDYFNPGYVLVENVPGILRRKNESGLQLFIKSLEDQGYVVHCEIVNMADYGIPQSRKRFSLVATRVLKKAPFPKKESQQRTVRDVIGKLSDVAAGDKDETQFAHTVAGLREKNLKRLQKTAIDGGSWLDWKNDPELKREKYLGNEFKDNYGRMWWDRPAPTITTKFFSISNGRFAHPEQNRAISIREGARLQTFSDSYEFKSTSIAGSAKLIGNAVPPLFAEKLAKAIIAERELSHGK